MNIRPELLASTSSWFLLPRKPTEARETRFNARVARKTSDAPRLRWTLSGCLMIADSHFCSTRLHEKEKEINKLKEQYEAEINNLRSLVRQKQRQLELMIGENRWVISTGPQDV